MKWVLLLIRLLGWVFYLGGAVGFVFSVFQILIQRPSDGDPDGKCRRRAIFCAFVCFAMILIGVFFRKEF